MSGDPNAQVDVEGLEREVLALRARVAELQRAAARHEDTEIISLPEREELLREAERIAHLGTWTWDVKSGRVTWSEELYRILGLDPSSVKPSVENFFAAVHPDDRERSQAAAAKSLGDGVLPIVDCRIIRPNGSIRHTVNSSSMLFDTKGEVRRVVGGVLDRTETLENERKLRRALSLLEEAQRSAQLGSWRFQPQTGEMEWSLEFRHIAGLPEDCAPSVELFEERVVPEERATFQQGHRESLTNPRGGQIDARLRRPNGELRHVRLVGYPVQSDGGITELRGTMLDVTDQVRLREELAHAQKMEAVGRLAGGIAHDFNNLLTVVTANLELIAERIGPAPELDDTRHALASATNLTRRLLAFGRKTRLQLRVLNPNDLVRSTTALLHRLVGDEIRIETDLMLDPPQVRIDALEIERALVNLVANARDVMPNGGVVRIGTRVRSEHGAQLFELSVDDEGPGIAEDDRSRIFEPFFTTRGDFGGTGLGLATVLGTAEQHGGTVRVDGRPSGGSVFTIILPTANNESSVEVPLAAVSRSMPPPRKLSLLVVDDEPMVADVTRRILERLGHTVRVSTRPEEVCALWSEVGHSIDLVICDVAMAPLRGPDLIAQLSQSHKPPKVLFITGYSEEALYSELSHPVLAKPFTASTLSRAIQDIVS